MGTITSRDPGVGAHQLGNFSKRNLFNLQMFILYTGKKNFNLSIFQKMNVGGPKFNLHPSYPCSHATE